MFLSHTSFLRPEKQREFRQRAEVPLDHYDIRVIVDSEEDAVLDEIERVEYLSRPDCTRSGRYVVTKLLKNSHLREAEDRSASGM